MIYKCVREADRYYFTHDKDEKKVDLCNYLSEPQRAINNIRETLEGLCASGKKDAIVAGVLYDQIAIIDAWLDEAVVRFTGDKIKNVVR